MVYPLQDKINGRLYPYKLLKEIKLSTSTVITQSYFAHEVTGKNGVRLVATPAVPNDDLLRGVAIRYDHMCTLGFENLPIYINANSISSNSHKNVMKQSNLMFYNVL